MSSYNNKLQIKAKKLTLKIFKFSQSHFPWQMKIFKESLPASKKFTPSETMSARM